MSPQCYGVTPVTPSTSAGTMTWQQQPMLQLSTVVTNINKSGGNAPTSTISMVIPSVIDLTKRFPQQFIPKISGKPRYSSIKAVHNLLIENAASVATTLGGGNYGHLALVMNPT
eukprot:6584264-Ditylum_brightwellii.AAC.1